jgi:hypothetical protein
MKNRYHPSLTGKYYIFKAGHEYVKLPEDMSWAERQEHFSFYDEGKEGYVK